jgi:two-component system nitrogen regulation sensor histidine kinase NtrY
MTQRSARRYRTVVLGGLALLLVVSLALIMNWRSDEDAFFSNIALFSLINLNILALLALIVMVGRNVIKLIFERKRGILGAKLRSRLVGSFVLIALIPMSLSFIVASGLINQAVQGWFNTQMESLVSSSLNLARQYVSQSKTSTRGASRRIQRDLLSLNDWSVPNSERVKDRLEQLRHFNDLFAIRIVTRDGSVLNEASHATAGVESFAEPPIDPETLKKVSPSDMILRIEELGASQFVRVYQSIGEAVLVSSYRMDPEMVHAQGVVNDAYNEYGDLKAVKDPIRANFFLILGLFNLLTLFGAIWGAFFISKQITGPIQLLAEGTRNIARGNYDFPLPEPTRDDEIGYLMKSFNQMVSDLNNSKREAQRRGSLIEAIISNLGVGVIALDSDKRVTAVNTAARGLLDVTKIESECLGQRLLEIVPDSQYSQLAPLVDSLADSGDEAVSSAVSESEIRLRRESRELIVVCTAGRIQGASGAGAEYILLLDDVTDISRAQHLAAWRDVARRIAHEIKNPLTPLQLSAQRLERLLDGKDVSQAVNESTRSIVEHVAIIKRLANEFSEYGRMPTALFAPSDLDAVTRGVVDSFRVDNSDIKFSYELKNKLPEMLLDPDQIRGVLINILANAVAAVRSDGISEDRRAISVTLDFDRKSAKAVLAVADFGPGVAAIDKNRVFEPYFTTKKGGTGLGLAIVSSVVSDHQGEISIFDNKPYGARFIITLPQHPQHTTLRRIGVA